MALARALAHSSSRACTVCVVQAIAQLAPMFPALPVSAIADALGKVGGDVQQAANALFAEQVNAREYLLPSAASRVLWDSTAVSVGSILICQEWRRGCFPHATLRCPYVAGGGRGGQQ
jgi:hypothetical protein